MELKNYFAQDSQGNAQPNATCYLYESGTENLVTGLVNGVDASITNPFYSDSYGLIQFKAPNGVYDLRVVSSVRDYRIRVQCLDVIETVAEAEGYASSAATSKIQAVDARDASEAHSIESLTYLSQSQAAALKAQLIADNLQEGIVTSLQEPNGSDLIGFDQSSSVDTIPRVLGDKVREHVSVKDFGAIGDGITNDTNAFIKAGKGAYVPAGYYLIDTMLVDHTMFNGPGVLYTTGGQVIRLDNDPISSFYVQRRMVAPRFGYDGAAGGGTGTDTNIYPLAQNAPQGLAYDRDPVTGEEFCYINQGVAGTSWSNTEYIRITKFRLRSDGAVQEVEGFTPAIRSTHAHLSCIRENGKLYMYQSAGTPLDAGTNTTTEAGKGWSKMEWKGASNTDADIVNYYVWGRPGSGHRYEYFGKGCTQVSQCGRYVLIIGINYTGTAGGRSLFIYDRKQVETASNPLDVMPIFAPLALKAMNNDAETAYQGETTDGRFVYICWGSGAPNARRGVSVYTMTGEKIRDICFEGPAEQYSNDDMDYGHPTLGDVMSFEPEGIFLKEDGIYVTFVDYWRKGCPVVSYKGKNYVSISTTNLGNVPNTNPLSWRPTKREADYGEWDVATSYSVTGPMTRRDKVIYKIGPKTGHPSEKPLISKYMYPYSIAVHATPASELVDMSFPLGQTWRASAHEYATDSYRMAFGYLFSYTWDVRDIREGSDLDVRTYMRTTAPTGGSQSSQFGTGDGTATGGGSLELIPSTSSASAGSVRLTTATGTVGSDLRLMIGGVTKVAVNDTETVEYQTHRPISDATYDMGTIARRYLGVRAHRYYVETSGVWVGSGTVSPEGVETASVGALYIHRGTGKWWRKSTGTGNTGWVETTV